MIYFLGLFRRYSRVNCMELCLWNLSWMNILNTNLNFIMVRPILIIFWKVLILLNKIKSKFFRFDRCSLSVIYSPCRCNNRTLLLKIRVNFGFIFFNHVLWSISRVLFLALSGILGANQDLIIHKLIDVLIICGLDQSSIPAGINGIEILVCHMLFTSNICYLFHFRVLSRLEVGNCTSSVVNWIKNWRESLIFASLDSFRWVFYLWLVETQFASRVTINFCEKLLVWLNLQTLCSIMDLSSICINFLIIFDLKSVIWFFRFYIPLS